MTCAQKIFDVEKQAEERGMARGMARGIARGIEIGMARAEAKEIARGEALFISLARTLLEQNRIDDLKAAAENPEARELLYQEFGLR